MAQSLLLNIIVTGAFALDQSSRGEDASLVQVSETLQNLLKSIEDEGRTTEGMFRSKQDWCSLSLKADSLSQQTMTESLEQLKSDLKEHEAAVDEATGTVKQIQVSITLANHIINRTEEVLQSRRAEEEADAEAAQQAQKDLIARQAATRGKSFLQAEAQKVNASLIAQRAEQHQRFLSDQASLLAIVENKRESLSSMQGELEAEYPLLAQLQELTAQTRRQIADRGESLQTSSVFSSSAQDDCQKASRRANAQAAARVGAANSIEAALQVLETATSARKVQKQQAPLSFVQFDMEHQSAITAADVFNLFPKARPRRRINLGFSEIQEDSSLMNPGSFQQGSVAQQPADAKPQITSLLTALKAEHSSESEHTQWCMQERARNELQLRLKSDTVDRLDAEISSHTDAQAQLDEDLSTIDTRVAFLEKAAKDVEVMGKKEKALAENSGRDHQLATRILDQAVAILSDFEARGAAEGFPAAVSKGAGSAASALRSARATFAALNSASGSYLQEVDEALQTVSDAAAEAVHSQKRERTNIELAKDKHEQKRSEAIQNRRDVATEVKTAQSFVQQLKAECGSKIYAEEDRRRADQIQALEDAKRTLDGQAVVTVVDRDPYGIDSNTNDGSAADKKELSPMERAAMEMGVSTN
jgi:hypothetical protein